eukprot:TRINITY_DN9516_c0_g1_i2.p3 TRINITY_DN9516_c0_g1~~TRINITY_DN9516_c0_g1_i2.p3  ORF type:complete len:169 (-),score=2.07 TRINITY_DN9516_c0_g1_i2:631-1137(-)
MAQSYLDSLIFIGRQFSSIKQMQLFSYCASVFFCFQRQTRFFSSYRTIVPENPDKYLLLTNYKTKNEILVLGTSQAVEEEQTQIKACIQTFKADKLVVQLDNPTIKKILPTLHYTYGQNISEGEKQSQKIVVWKAMGLNPPLINLEIAMKAALADGIEIVGGDQPRLK